MNHSEEEKQRLLDEQTQHLREAASARLYMNTCIDTCKAALSPQSHLGPNVPLSGPDIAHYCFDFAQQVSVCLTSIFNHSITLLIAIVIFKHTKMPYQILQFIFIWT